MNLGKPVRNLVWNGVEDSIYFNNDSITDYNGITASLLTTKVRKCVVSHLILIVNPVLNIIIVKFEWFKVE